MAAANPIILYLPAAGATLVSRYVDTTRTVFEDLGEVEVLDLTRPIPLTDLESTMTRATVLYIPGGNTYLLLDRLRRSGAFGLIQARVRAGVPLVGFSAGMIICGQSILTSNDKNDCEITEFAGLGFTEYNLNAHYPAADGEERERRDARIREYHASHANPVLALEDDGYVRIDGEGIHVIRGHCWLFRAGEEKALLEQGTTRQRQPATSCIRGCSPTARSASVPPRNLGT